MEFTIVVTQKIQHGNNSQTPLLKYKIPISRFIGRIKISKKLKITSLEKKMLLDYKNSQSFSFLPVFYI